MVMLSNKPEANNISNKLAIVIIKIPGNKAMSYCPELIAGIGPGLSLMR